MELIAAVLGAGVTFGALLRGALGLIEQYSAPRGPITSECFGMAFDSLVSVHSLIVACIRGASTSAAWLVVEVLVSRNPCFAMTAEWMLG